MWLGLFMVLASPVVHPHSWSKLLTMSHRANLSLWPWRPGWVATGVLTLDSGRISGRIYQAAQHYHVCGYFRPDDTVFFRISRHHVKEGNLKRWRKIPAKYRLTALAVLHILQLWLSLPGQVVQHLGSRPVVGSRAGEGTASLQGCIRPPGSNKAPRKQWKRRPQLRLLPSRQLYLHSLPASAPASWPDPHFRAAAGLLVSFLAILGPSDYC